MKKYKVYDIHWDVDDESELQDLPTEMIVDISSDVTDEENIEECISEILTDETGYCHDGFDYELLER